MHSESGSRIRSPGRDPLTRLVPDVGAAFTRLQAALWAMSSPRLALVDLRVAQLLRDDREPTVAWATPYPSGDTRREVSRWPSAPGFTDEERSCLSFAEQFVIDVGGIDDRLRSELASALGASGVLDFVVALFVLDYGRRVTMVLRALFPRDSASAAVDGDTNTTQPGGGLVLLGAFDDLSRAVALLDSIDPVTTELVRLRGARQHHCRLCQSTRSVRAVDAGADETVLGATEHYEASDLAEAQKVALRLTDAIITQPGSVDGTLAAQVHRWFVPVQAVELVMDVMRNSGQKIAVALAADDPHVASGVECFEITARGDVEYLG